MILDACFLPAEADSYLKIDRKMAELNGVHELINYV